MDDPQQIAIKLEEWPDSFGQGEGTVMMRIWKEHILSQVFSKYYRPFGIARRTNTAAFAGKGYEFRMVACLVLTVRPSTAVSQYAALQVALKALCNFMAQRSVGRLEEFFPYPD